MSKIKKIPGDIKILLSLDGKNPICVAGNSSESVTKKTNMVDAHVFKLIKELEEEGLVKTRKKGRKRLVFLTPKGERVRDAYKLYLKVRFMGLSY